MFLLVSVRETETSYRFEGAAESGAGGEEETFTAQEVSATGTDIADGSDTTDSSDTADSSDTTDSSDTDASCDLNPR